MIADQTGRRHLSRWSWLLLLTVPVAFFIGFYPVSIARFSRCGIDQCLGDPGGFASPSATFGVQAAIFAGVIMFAALAITPWLRPVWLRLIVAVVIAGLLAAYWIRAILFTLF
ncbi:MAG TPA: hypothetical protein VLZ78_12425 [Terrimesophilobacter sp.]|nr:hypothetical protein [Terrimesophilobacter sp.]